MVWASARRYNNSQEKFYVLFSDSDIDTYFHNFIAYIYFIEAEMKKVLYIFAAVLFIIANCCMLAAADDPVPLTSFGYGASADPVTVRVAIIDDKASINLSLKGKYKIYAYNPERMVMDGPFLSAKVSCTKDGLLVGSREIKAGQVSVRTERDGNIYVDGRRFRGSIDIVRKDNGRLVVVNRLGLDEYLYGVLYHEVSHRWPMEALKVQAIAARTFALYQMRQNKNQPYDLRSDIYSQVYGGKTSEKWATTAAVDRTKGEILTYKGDIFPTYYHATCGGYTEDASKLWNIDIGPLKGVPCNFCTASPHYKWSKTILLLLFESKLKEAGYKIGAVASVKVLSRDTSGRVDKIEIKDGSGTAVVLTGKDFRQILGPNEARSANFEASLQWGNLALRGYGWGHGVGMCQWGAFGQSRKGKKYDEILKYYYPGSEISTIDKIKL